MSGKCIESRAIKTEYVWKEGYPKKILPDAADILILKSTIYC